MAVEPSRLKRAMSPGWREYIGPKVHESVTASVLGVGRIGWVSELGLNVQGLKMYY